MPFYLFLGGLSILIAALGFSIRNAVAFRKNAEAYADKCIEEWREDGRKWEQ